jgi:peptide-methionine (S)-S-oxide reductase
MEIAIFAAGCFWGIEAAFQQVPGVNVTRVGYTGGKFDNPSYQDVCEGNTGHAEAVMIEYDPLTISFEKLLELFFSLHDPTTKDRQGPDIGAQYRSAIFYSDDKQREKAVKMIKNLENSGKYHAPVVTEIIPASKFWPAEENHQSYYLKMGRRYGGLT